jgi:hypothetical protein
LEDGIAVEEIVALQARVTAGQLQAEDLSRLSKLLELLLTLLQMIEQPKLKLRQLWRKLFGKSDGCGSFETTGNPVNTPPP